MGGSSTAQPQILLIEDEPLIAMYIEDALMESGFAVTGPFETVATGSDAARQFDGVAALVDLYLHGNDATIVTKILAERKIPFVVMTGWGDFGPSRAVAAPILKKPFLIADLVGAIRDACAV